VAPNIFKIFSNSWVSELSKQSAKGHTQHFLNNPCSRDEWVAYGLSCSKCGWKLYGTQGTEYGLDADVGALRANLHAWKPFHIFGKQMEAATQPLQVHRLMVNSILPSNHLPSSSEVGLKEKKVSSCSANLSVSQRITGEPTGNSSISKHLSF
jgi:hypothetical protein